MHQGCMWFSFIFLCFGSQWSGSSNYSCPNWYVKLSFMSPLNSILSCCHSIICLSFFIPWGWILTLKDFQNWPIFSCKCLHFASKMSFFCFICLGLLHPYRAWLFPSLAKTKAIHKHRKVSSLKYLPSRSSINFFQGNKKSLAAAGSVKIYIWLLFHFWFTVHALYPIEFVSQTDFFITLHVSYAVLLWLAMENFWQMLIVLNTIHRFCQPMLSILVWILSISFYHKWLNHKKRPQKTRTSK